MKLQHKHLLNINQKNNFECPTDELLSKQATEISLDFAKGFAEFLRLNYQNSVLEFDNYWEEVEQGEFHLQLGKAFTTEELLEKYIKTN